MPRARGSRRRGAYRGAAAELDTPPPLVPGFLGGDSKAAPALPGRLLQRCVPGASAAPDGGGELARLHLRADGEDRRFGSHGGGELARLHLRAGGKDRRFGKHFREPVADARPCPRAANGGAPARGVWSWSWAAEDETGLDGVDARELSALAALVARVGGGVGLADALGPRMAASRRSSLWPGLGRPQARIGTASGQDWHCDEGTGRWGQLVFSAFAHGLWPGLGRPQARIGTACDW